MDGVADKAKDIINSKFGREIVFGAYSPSYGFEKKQEENEAIYKMINESGGNCRTRWCWLSEAGEMDRCAQGKDAWGGYLDGPRSYHRL